MKISKIKAVDMVREFHEMAELTIGNPDKAMKKSIVDLRIRLIMEETFETVQALCVEDYTNECRLETLDGLCDVAYVSAGSTISRGTYDQDDFLTGKVEIPSKDPTVVRAGLAMVLLDAANSMCFALRQYGRKSSNSESLSWQILHDTATALNTCCFAIACELKLPFDAGFQEVHNANMAKRLKDGTVFHDAGGKLMKPEGFIKPNLKYVLKHGKPKKRPAYTKPPKGWKIPKGWIAKTPKGQTDESI